MQIRFRDIWAKVSYPDAISRGNICVHQLCAACFCTQSPASSSVLFCLKDSLLQCTEDGMHQTHKIGVPAKTHPSCCSLPFLPLLWHCDMYMD